MYEKFVLVFTQTADLMLVVSLEQFDKMGMCITTKVIIDVYAGCPFYNTIPSLGRGDVSLPEN